MKREIASAGGFAVFVWLIASISSAQTPPAGDAGAYQNRCASLPWFRDDRRKRAGHSQLREISHRRRSHCGDSRAPRKRGAISLQEAELRQILSAHPRAWQARIPRWRQVVLQDVAAVRCWRGRWRQVPGVAQAPRRPLTRHRQAERLRADSPPGIEHLRRPRSRWQTDGRGPESWSHNQKSPRCSGKTGVHPAFEGWATATAKKRSRQRRTGRTTTAA